jgi:hypothetical protein
MAVRRNEESLRPPVMLFKPEGVLKIGAHGPELAAELDGHVTTCIFVASGEPECVFPTPRLDQAGSFTWTRACFFLLLPYWSLLDMSIKTSSSSSDEDEESSSESSTIEAPPLTIGAPAAPIGLAPSPPAAAADGDAWDGRASEPVAVVAAAAVS